MTKNQRNLYCLGKDKDIVLKTLSKNEDLIRLLLPTYNPETTTEDLDVILQNHMYDTITIDNSQGKARAYICVEAFVTHVESDVIKEIGIIINVFCHESLIHLDKMEKVKYVKAGYYGNRIDALIDCVDRCLNGKRGVGIGRVRLRPRTPIEIYRSENGYYGKSLNYIVSDFNTIDKL